MTQDTFICTRDEATSSPDIVNNLTRLPFRTLTYANGKFSTCIEVMKKEQLNFRKFRLFSPAGMDLKYTMGNRIKFQTVQTTNAFAIAANRIDEPMVASFAAS